MVGKGILGESEVILNYNLAIATALNLPFSYHETIFGGPIFT